MSIKISVSDQACGAEITGINLKKDLSGSQISEIRDLWLQYHVLSFPNQSMDDDDLERFTLYFGSFGDDPFIAPISGRKNIIAVKRQRMKRFQYLQTIGTQIGVFKKTLQQVLVFMEKLYQLKAVILYLQINI